MPVSGNTARIERALHYRLSHLVLNPVRRVADPGEVFDPVQTEIYLQPDVLWNTSERGEIGPHAARRHRGIFQVQVRGPSKGNPEPMTEVADAVIEHFDRQVITLNSVTVRIGAFDGGTDTPWRGNRLVEGGRALVAVSIPFWCDIFPS